jgi:hypothetical protein
VGGVLEHLERHLGPADAGWSRGADGSRMPFQVVRFAGGRQIPGIVAFSTLGLSRRRLRSPPSGRDVRMELLVLLPEAWREAPVPSILQSLGSGLVETRIAIRRGDVIGPQGPLVVPDATVQSFYTALPAYLPEEFATCAEDGYAVAIAWLLPITVTEARYISRNGWSAFEARLAEYDPELADLTDPLRPSVPLRTPGPV